MTGSAERHPGGTLHLPLDAAWAGPIPEGKCSIAITGFAIIGSPTRSGEVANSHVAKPGWPLICVHFFKNSVDSTKDVESECIC